MKRCQEKQIPPPKKNPAIITHFVTFRNITINISVACLIANISLHNGGSMNQSISYEIKNITKEKIVKIT